MYFVYLPSNNSFYIIKSRSHFLDQEEEGSKIFPGDEKNFRRGGEGVKINGQLSKLVNGKLQTLQGGVFFVRDLFPPWYPPPIAMTTSMHILPLML